MKYCSNCGQKLITKEIISEGIIPYCQNCNKVYFPHNAACIIAIIMVDDKFLLIKQPELGDNYCLVSGHIKAKMTAEEALKAEIKEEVNLEVEEYHYLGSYYHAKSNHLMLGYFVKAYGDICINEELSAYKLFDLAEALDLIKVRKCGSYFFAELLKKDLIK